jgi:ATP-dependent Lhr-like helicase
VERGGKTVLTFSDDEEALAAASVSLASIVRTGLGKLRIEQVDGVSITGSPLGIALGDAGFSATPRGLSLRA